MIEPMLKIFSCFMLPVVLLVLTGCQEAPLPPGTIASVNGEAISLHSLQALLDSRSAALGIPRRPSVREMQAKYRHALSILIVHALIRQDLAARGIELKNEDIDKEIQKISEDFGAESLQEYFDEVFLREDEWRQLMRDHLAVRLFTDKVLGPEVTVSLAEVKEYYEGKKADFILPENARICLAVSESREQIEEWCKVGNGEDFETGSFAQCMDVTLKEAPEQWGSELKKLKPGHCGKLISEGGVWKTVGLVEKNPVSEAPLPEVYGLIEAILLEEKKLEVFDKWLSEKLASSRILVSPELFSPLGK